MIFRDFHEILTAWNIPLENLTITDTLLETELEYHRSLGKDGKVQAFSCVLEDESLVRHTWYMRFDTEQGIFHDGQLIPVYTETGAENPLYSNLSQAITDLNQAIVLSEVNESFGGDLESLKRFQGLVAESITEKEAELEASLLEAEAEAEALEPIAYTSRGQLDPAVDGDLDLLVEPVAHDTWEITADGTLTWNAGVDSQAVLTGEYLVIDSDGLFTFNPYDPSLPPPPPPPTYVDRGLLDPNDSPDLDLITLYGNPKPFDVWEITAAGAFQWLQNSNVQVVSAGEFLVIDENGEFTFVGTSPLPFVPTYVDRGSLDPTTDGDLDLLATPASYDVWEFSAGGTVTWNAGVDSQVVNIGEFLVIDENGDYTFTAVSPLPPPAPAPAPVTPTYADRGAIDPATDGDLDLLPTPAPFDVWVWANTGTVTWAAGANSQAVTASEFLVIDGNGDFTFTAVSPLPAPAAPPIVYNDRGTLDPTSDGDLDLLITPAANDFWLVSADGTVTWGAGVNSQAVFTNEFIVIQSDMSYQFTSMSPI
jgi:hypothetical protein